MPLLRTKTTIVNSGDVFGDVFGFFKKTGFVIQKDCILKGKCHEIFETFFVDKKTQPGPQMNRQKGFRKFFTNIFAKNREKTCVPVVVDYTVTDYDVRKVKDYANTVSTCSLTTLTLCQHSQ